MLDKVAGTGRIVMEDREKLSLTGVRKVQSFDPKEILIDTTCGLLSIKGEKLGMKHLDLKEGNAEIEGRMDAISYLRQANGESRQNFWGRIFR